MNHMNLPNPDDITKFAKRYVYFKVYCNTTFSEHHSFLFVISGHVRTVSSNERRRYSVMPSLIGIDDSREAVHQAENGL